MILTTESVKKIFLSVGYYADYSLHGNYPINKVVSRFKLHIVGEYSNQIKKFCENFINIESYSKVSRIENDCFFIEKSEKIMEIFIESILEFIRKNNLIIELQDNLY